VSTPPFLLGAALLFWGWTAGLLAYAIPMALFLELSHGTAWRWNLGGSDHNRTADLCSVLFVGMLVYAVSETRPVPAVYALLQWSPLALFPLMAVQAYGAEGRIRLTAFFLSLRRVREHRERIGSVDISYPYLLLCLLAASLGPGATQGFYVACCILLAWTLWSVRPPGHRAAAWAAVLVSGLASGYALQGGLREGQLALEQAVGSWLSGMYRHRTDPYRATTAFGHIGRLKLSGRILLRVSASRQPPSLLREASYNTYTAYSWPSNPDSLGVGTWLAKRASFRRLQTRDGATWDLGKILKAGREVTVSGYLERGKGLLALPNGTYRVGQLPVDQVERNELGAVRVEGGPELVTYMAQFGPGGSAEEAPTEGDLQIPKVHRATLRQVAQQLGIGGLDAGDAVRAVESFFARGFSYSLAALQSGERVPSLEEFLLGSHAGHCEYFATATVLLLRELGVPARYAVGYAVQEYSPREQRYLVRSSHAHSWALAYYQGTWQDVDTTPPGWADLEAAARPPWEAVYDLGSWALYALARWRASQGSDGLRTILAWLLIPLLTVLLWRLGVAQRVRRAGRTPEGAGRPATGPGQDSEFYAVVDRLRLQGFERPLGEPLGTWIARLSASAGAPGTEAPLRALADLHCRYRFDPAGLSEQQREELRRGVQHWLAARRPGFKDPSG
jgi:hypothetical protein